VERGGKRIIPYLHEKLKSSANYIRYAVLEAGVDLDDDDVIELLRGFYFDSKYEEAIDSVMILLHHDIFSTLIFEEYLTIETLHKYRKINELQFAILNTTDNAQLALNLDELLYKSYPFYQFSTNRKHILAKFASEQTKDVKIRVEFIQRYNEAIRIRLESFGLRIIFGDDEEIKKIEMLDRQLVESIQNHDVADTE